MKQKPFIFSLLIKVLLLSTILGCSDRSKKRRQKTVKQLTPENPIYKVKISSKHFFASYKGPDFVNGDDIAHQLSNFVADTLGKFLKSEYRKGRFKKIDFEQTIIQTKKNHDDSVYYTIKMPFLNVTACESFTCIDHRGSWVLNKRKTDSDLKEFLFSIQTTPNHKEDVKLFQTESGLYEYWVQFKSTELQKNCK
jgi:hypothetical protein